MHASRTTINGEYVAVSELRERGVTCGGDDVRVHHSVVIVQPENLILANHTRIDPFCIISATGTIRIGQHVHISGHCSLLGEAGIEIEDFASISHGVKIFTAADIHGAHLVGPTVPDSYRKVLKAPVRVKRHAAITVGAVLMPGVTVGEGAVVGPMSFVRRNVPEWTVWVGVPARRIAIRPRNALELGEKLLAQSGDDNATL
jgi:acetyltransferase-like isoleucine patch superfamily enzyme